MSKIVYTHYLCRNQQFVARKHSLMIDLLPPHFHLQLFVLDCSVGEGKPKLRSHLLNQVNISSVYKLAKQRMAITTHFVLGIFGNVFGIGLFVVPLITFISVVRRGSTGEYSGIPYVFALFNCLVYTWYGLPFVTSDNLLVSSVNGCGVILEILYISLYLAYAPSNYRMNILRLFTGVLVLFAAIVAFSVLAFHGRGRKLFVGIIGVAVSVAMFAAPLSIMKLVVQTRSVEFMPFFLSLTVFLCGFAWFFYGILGRDIFVALPNGLGALLGAIQILLYCAYRNSSRNYQDYERPLVQ